MLLPRIAPLASNRELFAEFQSEDKLENARIEKFELEKLELRNLSSIRVSNRIIPPSEICCATHWLPDGVRTNMLIFNQAYGQFS